MMIFICYCYCIFFRILIREWISYILYVKCIRIICIVEQLDFLWNKRMEIIGILFSKLLSFVRKKCDY